MQYRNLAVGQTVFYSTDRTSSRDFSLSQCDQAEVIGLGVEHSYYAKGGFAGGGGTRTTGQGVRVRLVTNYIGRKTTEFVTVAAHLVEANEANCKEWEEARARIDAKIAEKERHTAELDALDVRFKACGFDVTVRTRFAGGAPTLAMNSVADVERLLAWIESSPGPLAG